MRSWPLVIALCFTLACAGAPRRLEGTPSRVVVIAASVAPRPSPRGLVGDVFGGEEPRDVVARAGSEALRSRGYEVVGVETVLGPAPTQEEAAAMARQSRAEAAVVLVLSRLDLSALQPLGQAQVGLEFMMVDPAGQVLVNEGRSTTTTEQLYRARTDWRSHVRQAVIQAVRKLP